MRTKVLTTNLELFPPFYLDAQAITDALVATMGTKPEWVTVHIDEFERENWAVGGVLDIDKDAEKHVEKGV
ncbi:4-oxalocrotonate tautomerase family protein [Pelatocladus sp. BLCC-F211]|uniref:tautomerase family protein n=1 Tax=Pelatocladus sp. BLCC-F211 TaxID=3342752 RepID=UPI0035BB7497